jgi:hypothetical protein
MTTPWMGRASRSVRFVIVWSGSSARPFLHLLILAQPQPPPLEGGEDILRRCYGAHGQRRDGFPFEACA